MLMDDIVTDRLTVLPRAAVSACLFRGDAVLLVKRAKPPYLGAWSLPGGSIEPGETAELAIEREIAEETGLDCQIVGLADINDVIKRDPTGALVYHYVIAVFAGTADDGEPIAGDDAAEARFFSPDELDGLGLGRRTTGIIARARTLITRR
jgi:8-oxo-dGTP diphosphatase